MRCAQSPRLSSNMPALSGEKAMEYVRAQVAFGPRPPGSPALEKCREYIEQQLRGFGYQVEDDAFVAQTPYGPDHDAQPDCAERKAENGV